MGDILKLEWDKLMIKQKGWLWILFCIVLLLMGALLPGIFQGDSETGKQLQRFYAEYGGALTEDTRNAIQEKKTAIENALQRQNQGYADYESGKITETELKSILGETAEILRDRRAFDRFYGAYRYCAEDPDKRYLVETDGWFSLLYLGTPNFVLLFFVVWLTAMVYKSDVQQDIRRMIQATCRGRTLLLYGKWLVAASAAMLLWLCGMLVDYIAALPVTYGRAPLQSLKYFAGSPYPVTFLQTYLLGNGVRLFGVLYCAMLTAAAIELSGNAVIGSFLSLAIVILPFIVGSAENLYLQLPIPTGFVQAFSYFLGVPGTVNNLTCMGRNLIVSLSVMAFLLICARIHYVGFRRKRRIPTICVGALLLLCLTGCGHRDDALNMDYGEDYSFDQIEAEDYWLYRREEMVVVEKETGREYPLFCDPLEPEELKPTFSCGKTIGNTVYFLYSDEQYTQTIQAIDLDTGERIKLFADATDHRDVKIFDVVIWESTARPSDREENYLKDFFFCNGKLILLREMSISMLQNGWEIPLYSGEYKDLTAKSGDIWFTNAEGEIICLEYGD